MPDTKISALTPGGPAQAGDVIPMERSGANFSLTAQQLSSPSGMNVADVPWNFFDRNGATLPTSGYTLCQIMFANSIRVFTASWKVSINVTIAFTAPIGEMCVIRTLKDSLATVDVTPILFGGSATPTFTTGTKTSDVVNVQIDAAHDYYFCFTGNPFGGSGTLAADSRQDTTSYGGNTNNGGNKCSITWASSVGAGGGFNGAFPLGTPYPYFLTGWTVA